MIKIKVNTNKVLGKISPMVYGQMVEHAYWSVHMGLCAQMLDNGGFEIDRDGTHRRVAQGWKVIKTNNATEFRARLDEDDPYNGGACQKIAIDRYAGGVVRLQQNSLSVLAGKRYRGFVMLKGDYGKASIRLFTTTQRCMDVYTCTLTPQWTKVEFSLLSDTDDFTAIFAIEFAGEGAAYIDQAFLYPEECYGGTRLDMVKLYADLKPPFVRWPGGSYLVWHHWKEGIGPLEDRPYNDGRILRDHNFGVYHDGEWDSNAFGTDEFIAFCRSIGSEPMINVNIKDGLQNTLDWIEYCNGSADTVWGAKRAGNGHPEPYNVKYWVIDNEPLVMLGEKGFCPETFPIDSAVWARAMKEKDPSITVMCMGDHDLYNYIYEEPVFSEAVVRAAKENIDHLCVHIYYDQSVTGPLEGMPYQMGSAFARLKAMMDRVSPERSVKVFLSEWNPESNTNVGGNMGQALEAAQMFHVMERASAQGIMEFATPCQLCVNVDKYRGFWLRAAMVQINNHSAWTNPMYHVNRMYSRLRQPNLLDLEWDQPLRSSNVFDGYEFPALDVIATAAEDKKTVVLKICNNSDTEDFALEFTLAGGTAGKTTLHEVYAPDILAMNSQFTPDTVQEQISELPHQEGHILYTSKRGSVALLEIAAE